MSYQVRKGTERGITRPEVGCAQTQQAETSLNSLSMDGHQNV